MWTKKNWLGRNKTLTQCGKYFLKKSICASQHHSLTMFIRVVVSILSTLHSHWSLYTNIAPSLFFFFFLQLVHRKTPLSCTIHSLTSVHAHLDRTGLESIVFSETSAVLSSCTRTWWRSRFVEMAEPLDAQLLKDLRGLGKPLSFDGNDAEYQDFRNSFRIHMSLVSAVSHMLMDKCEIERNPISLAAAKALGDAHLKCCIQMYYSLALITKGSVRTLVRSVEESNGAEAWRLIHSRYAPDTQNRQYALMQKIMMPAKLWCDHAEGFESGVRAWELVCRKMGTRFWNCVGRCSQVHSDDEYGTDFYWEQFAVGYIRQQCCSSNSFVAMELLFPKLWSESDRVSWKWN